MREICSVSNYTHTHPHTHTHTYRPPLPPSVPDDMVMQVLLGRLTQLDCASRGWVLHGFPLTRDQAELLTKAGHRPNRSGHEPSRSGHRLVASNIWGFVGQDIVAGQDMVLVGQDMWTSPLLPPSPICRVFFLDVPEDSVKERLTLWRTDPLTGNRYVGACPDLRVMLTFPPSGPWEPPRVHTCIVIVLQVPPAVKATPITGDQGSASNSKPETI